MLYSRAILTVLLLALAAAMPHTAMAEEKTDLLPHVRQSLQDAIRTQNPFVIEATISAAAQRYPAKEDAIYKYAHAEQATFLLTGTFENPVNAALSQEELIALGVMGDTLDEHQHFPALVEIVDVDFNAIEPAAGPKTSLDEAAETSKKGWLSDWKGAADLGVDWSNGNTDRQRVNAGVKVTKETENWKHDASVKVRTTREDNARTEEKYTIKGDTNYKLDERTFVFADADYVNDTFSGFEYRITESVGVGYSVVKKEDFQIDIKGSVGGRHSKLTDSTTQNEMIFKPAADLMWEITENLSFTQNVAATVGDENTITEATSALTNKLTDSLFLRISFDVEHISDVPAGRKQTDTATGVNLVYEF